MNILFDVRLIALIGTGIVTIFTSLWFLNFRKLIQMPVQPNRSDTELPRTLVMLCLRGSDPFLPETLRALTRQTYPNFDLRVVIDHPGDSSAEVVNDFQQATGFDRLQIRYLHQRRQTCGLKVSALVQELADLDASYEAVVQLDADAVPYPDWLREMITPLADPKVGATSGLRWYMPNRGNWATLARYIWGISATVQMYQFGMPWGGSLGFRRDLLTQTPLLDLWTACLTEDLVIDRVLQQAGLRLCFVPAVMVNREETTFQGSYHFIRRQVILALHYHDSWTKVAGYALFFGACVVITVLTNFYSMWVGDSFWTKLGWIGFNIYLSLFALMIYRTERTVRQKVKAQGGALTPFDFRLLIAMPLALGIHVAATISALMTRHVHWRGAAYELSPGGRVRVLRDVPYVENKTARQASIV